MGGLTKTNPLLGWGLVIGVAAIAGLPPLGIFTSEFLMVSATFARAAAARASARARPADRRRRAVPAAEPHRLRRAEGREPQGEVLLCADVRCISRWCSPPASICRRHARRLVPGGGEAARIGMTMAALTDIAKSGRKAEAHRPWPRVIVGARGWQSRRAASGRGARHPARPVGRQGRRCIWRCSKSRRPTIAVFTARMPRRQVPLGRRASSAGHPARARHPRPVRPEAGRRRRHAGRGSISASGA